MIPLIVSPYSFRGSIVRFEELVERLDFLGMRSAILADLNFHGAVEFNEIMRNCGKVPIHALVVGGKVLIALNREGFESLVRFHNGLTRRLSGVIVKDVSDFKVVMYLSRRDRKGYEAMRKVLELDPIDKDFSMEGELDDPIEFLDVEEYDLRVKQVFREPPHDWPCVELDGIRAERLEKELKTVERMNLKGYFHAVERIVKRAKEMGIKIGPGRGSAVGSFLVNVLGITSVDPMEYDLLFERFLNEGRREPPDIDIDVEDIRRKDLIKSLEDEFGFVAMISTFSRLKNRSLMREARRLGLDDETVEMLKDLPVRRSVHAAGVIVSEKGMNLPLVPGDHEIPIVEYDMDSLKKIGVEKIDVLGLRTLSFLRALEESTGESVNNFQEKGEVFESISKGLTSGVFQLESAEAKRIARLVRPSSKLELSHLLALNRPGPLKIGAHVEYFKRGLEGFEIEPGFEILKETRGIPIYQEQIMILVSKLAGFTLEEADDIRRAVSKKDKKIMAGVLKEIERRMLGRYEPDFVERTLNLIEKFSSYAFNKSHSVAYAHLSYWLSYFKEFHFPEFFREYLKWNRSDPKKCTALVQEAIHRGYRLSVPDINHPDGGFINGSLLPPLHVIKGFSEKIVESVRSSLPIYRISDLRMDRVMLENLVKAGAFDRLYGSRKEALEVLKRGESARITDRLKAKLGLIKRSDVGAESEIDRTLMEYDSMGFSITVPSFESELPTLAEVVSTGISRASHVRVVGRLIYDGRSSLVLKRGLGDGERIIVFDPEVGVIKVADRKDVVRIVYRAGYRDSVERFIERSVPIESVELNGKLIENARLLIDSEIIFIYGK